MSTSSHERTANAFDQQAKDALQDSVLTQALRNATDKFAERRTAAIAAVPDWQALREQARQVKDATVAGLADYIEQFADNAERAGATVHWARDGKEARRRSRRRDRPPAHRWLASHRVDGEPRTRRPTNPRTST